MIIDSASTTASEKVNADFGQTAQLRAVAAALRAYARAEACCVWLLRALTAAESLAGGNRFLSHFDVHLRLDPYPIVDDRDGVVDHSIRLLWIDGRNRQGRTNAEAFLAITEGHGFRSLTEKERRRLKGQAA